jgi:tetratricopeptide (TPR) repeat protein
MGFFNKILRRHKSLGTNQVDKMEPTTEKNDGSTVFQICLKEAENGDAKSQFDLACMYTSGKEVAQDYKEATKWLEMSAKQGFSTAQNELGVLYGRGALGLVQDYEKAFAWYKLAAEQGYATAQSNLGFMLIEGQGVVQNYSEALKWYKLAAEQGHSGAQYVIGKMFRYGLGVTPDQDKAERYYKLAASNGHSMAKLALAKDIKLDLEIRYGHFWLNWVEFPIEGFQVIKIDWVDGPTKKEIESQLINSPQLGNKIQPDLTRVQSEKSRKSFGDTAEGFQKWKVTSLPYLSPEELLKERN